MNRFEFYHDENGLHIHKHDITVEEIKDFFELPEILIDKRKVWKY